MKRVSTICAAIGAGFKIISYLLYASPVQYFEVAVTALITALFGAAGKHLYDLFIKPYIVKLKNKIYAMVTMNVNNSGKQSPLWFRKFKKIYTNLENVALTLLVFKFPQDSFTFVLVKIGSNALLENLETILAPAPSDSETKND